MSKKKIIIEIDAKPIWNASKGHNEYRGGSGHHQDRRTKRNRTRSDKNKAAIREW